MESTTDEDRTAYLMLETVAAEVLHFAANQDSKSQIRVGRILATLQKPVIDMLQLRAIALTSGLPESAPCLRALVWKLFLGVISPVRAEWTARLSKLRADYADYVLDLINEPDLITSLREGVCTTPMLVLGPTLRVPTEDHPLSNLGTSRWRQFWKDSDIFDQVNKDVYRTRVETDFFHEWGSAAMNSVTVRSRRWCVEDSSVPTSPKSHSFVVADVIDPKTHYDRICRILFLFAKLNFGYVQGMNELLAPLYFVFVNDSVDGHYAESDAFFAFTTIMILQRDIFTKTMDQCNSGIMGRLIGVEELIRKHDLPVYFHLKKNGVKISFFALRWVLLLFSQEFDLFNIQILWDSLLADDDGQSRSSSLIAYVCVAMVVLVRQVLLASNEFGDMLKILQRYPPFDPREIINLAQSLRRNSPSSPRLEKSESALSTASDDMVISALDHPHSVTNSFYKSTLGIVKEKDRYIDTRFFTVH